MVRKSGKSQGQGFYYAPAMPILVKIHGEGNTCLWEKGGMLTIVRRSTRLYNVIAEPLRGRDDIFLPDNNAATINKAIQCTALIL